MLVADRLVFVYRFVVFVGGYIIGEHVVVGNEKAWVRVRDSFEAFCCCFRPLCGRLSL